MKDLRHWCNLFSVPSHRYGLSGFHPDGTVTHHCGHGASDVAMFAYGFGAIFILTQLYGLGLKKWQEWAFIGIYIGSALYVYNGRLLDGLLEIIRIPAIDYILIFILSGIFWLIIKLMALIRKDERISVTAASD